ncbi:MAG: DUF4397 domain-containing protein [Flavobacteriales bacterium]|nr:MAG: DUF4397 domain-containing protein [Flavobacteriales bacterium]
MNPNLKPAAFALGLLCTSGAFAEGGGVARVQVIHNCADLAAASVDVWLDNALLLDNFVFRSASPFIDAPAGVPLNVGVAPPNSTQASDAIFNLSFTLTAGETYVVVASGTISPIGYSPATPFSLEVFAQGREVANGGPLFTDVLVLHGATDAPMVDVYENVVTNSTVVNDLSYPSYAGYLELPTLDFGLQVRTADNSTIVAAYEAPLATLGLGGAAITVLASGFLDPAVNSGGPAFGLFAALASGGPLVPLPTASIPTARAQIIHNCADLGASTVDIWLNNTLLIDDLEFRTASPFVDLQAGVDLTVGVAPPNSTQSSDALVQVNYNLEDGLTYVLVASGTLGGPGYQPATPFSIEVFDQGREASNGGAMMTDVLVLHGATDAPNVDVFESDVVGAMIVDDLSYPSFAGYLELPTADYTVQVRTADNSTIVAAYGAPLSTLGLGGSALVVLASGFLDPTVNSNGPAFGLWAALPSGGALVPLPSASIPTSRLQLIHNSADLAASTVDVWLNNTLLLDDFEFRTASPFVDAQAGVDLNVGIALPNSTQASDAIYNQSFNLEADETYVVVANGIVSSSGYNPLQPFNLYAFAGAREVANTSTNTDILVFHGATDAPVVDVAETAVLGGATLVDDLAYGEFNGYLEVATGDYALQVQDEQGAPLVNYQAPLALPGLDGAALTVLASGFLAPTQNSNGPAFGLWVALAGGGDLVELPLITSVEENDVFAGSALWPVPVSDVLSVELKADGARDAQLRVMDATGREVMSVADNIALNGATRLEVPVSTLAPGHYSLQVLSGNAVKSMVFHVAR